MDKTDTAMLSLGRHAERCPVRGQDPAAESRFRHYGNHLHSARDWREFDDLQLCGRHAATATASAQSIAGCDITFTAAYHKLITPSRNRRDVISGLRRLSPE